jgi:hypothetical protein
MITRLLFGAAMKHDHLAFMRQSKRGFVPSVGFGRKAAQQRRTPKRNARDCARENGHVLECGSVLPLSADRTRVNDALPSA